MSHQVKLLIPILGLAVLAVLALLGGSEEQTKPKPKRHTRSSMPRPTITEPVQAPLTSPIRTPRTPRSKPNSISRSSDSSQPTRSKLEAILEALDRLRAESRSSFTPGSEAEVALLKELEALGPEALPLIEEKLRRGARSDHWLFLSRGLLAIPGANGLVEQLLAELEGDALLALVRALPDEAESHGPLGRAFVSHARAEERRALLRELAARKGLDRSLILAVGLKDSDPVIRGESAAFLARIAAPEDIETLRTMAQRDVDVGVRERALVALGAIGGPRAREAVLALAFDREVVPALRASAAVALGRLGEQEALQRLASEDPEGSVRRRARSILALLRQR